MSRASDLADQIVGTCEGTAVGDELESFSPAELAEFDSLVFCCDQCQWWFEQPGNDTGSGWVCNDCFEEEK